MVVTAVYIFIGWMYSYFFPVLYFPFFNVCLGFISLPERFMVGLVFLVL